MRVSGRYAYLADGQAGLQVIDVSDPAQPVRVGGCNTGGRAMDVEIAGDRAYVADFYAGLRIVDISNPANPDVIGTFDTGIPGGQIAESPHALQVVSDLAYLADGHGDLQIVDISNPTHPMRVGTYAVAEGYVHGVHVAGPRAYLVGARPVDEDHSTGVSHILDVTQPANPVRLGVTDVASYGYGVAASGQFAYVVGEDVALTVVKVSDPGNPLSIAQHDTFGWANAVQIVGNYAFLAGEHLGLLVLDVTNPAQPFRAAQYSYGTSGRRESPP